MRVLREFMFDEGGFSAAEIALLTMLALGMALVVAKFILSGATTAATKVQQGLSSQSLPSQ